MPILAPQTEHSDKFNVKLIHRTLSELEVSSADLGDLQAMAHAIAFPTRAIGVSFDADFDRINLLIDGVRNSAARLSPNRREQLKMQFLGGHAELELEGLNQNLFTDGNCFIANHYRIRGESFSPLSTPVSTENFLEKSGDIFTLNRNFIYYALMTEDFEFAYVVKNTKVIKIPFAEYQELKESNTLATDPSYDIILTVEQKFKLDLQNENNPIVDLQITATSEYPHDVRYSVGVEPAGVEISLARERHRNNVLSNEFTKLEKMLSDGFDKRRLILEAFLRRPLTKQQRNKAQLERIAIVSAENSLGQIDDRLSPAQKLSELKNISSELANKIKVFQPYSPLINILNTMIKAVNTVLSKTPLNVRFNTLNTRHAELNRVDSQIKAQTHHLLSQFDEQSGNVRDDDNRSHAPRGRGPNRRRDS